MMLNEWDEKLHEVIFTSNKTEDRAENTFESVNM
jgi:hypothetical protein